MRFIILALLLTTASCSLTAKPTSPSASEVKQAIQNTLEQRLYQLPPRVQGHYGIRLFRMTGDDKYVNSALVDLYAITEAQSFYACSADDPNFIKAQAEAMTARLGNGPRATARKAALTAHPQFLFYSDGLLRYASRIDEFGLVGPCHNTLTKAIKDYDMTQALTDPAMIKSWAAQLINYVYWSKQLGTGDYLEVYTKAFNQVYPDTLDGQLDKSQFRNKLYGLTHFVFAASGYYQRPIDAKEFGWILDYFSDNIERILTDATDDIIAEVGVAFLLAGKGDNPVVQRAREHIIKSFDQNAQFIPSISGRIEYASGEHRNVLAMMLLEWTEQLHPGPMLAIEPASKFHLPKQVRPKQE
ncbi:DUF3541 domain-containing protein [Paraferrimonas haliotis]|uniref:DUF3541 domain-containing protein n=1 Tax=Paraferrimonas haliotis TaxID=2013866 RepID=UPI000BA98D93|nr:DUF3541 domain-containing protein [Paraferrimonas haliotis]